MDLFDAFVLGGDVEYLKNAEVIMPTAKERGPGRELSLMDVLRRIRRNLTEFGINETMARLVEEWITKLRREYRAGQEIEQKDSEALGEDADTLEALLERALLDRPVIEFTRRGALNQRALIATSRGDSSSIFDEKIWDGLPIIAKSDFADAAKCLLFEASTPAAMIALRGMEGVIRGYYEFSIGRECGKKSLGSITKELRSLPYANTKLLDYIDYLRSEKRNLAQHPDKVFTQREAERIFMEIISAVYDIHSEITDTKV